MNTSYVLQNLQLTDGQHVDIVINNRQISEITTAGKGIARHKYDYSGCFVSSGWIDLHVHAHNVMHPYGDEIDAIGIQQGVTTIVDAGSCGADHISDLFLEKTKAKTTLYAFLNVSKIGLTRIDELSNLNWLDQKALVHACNSHSEGIVGLKVRMSKSVVKDNGLKPLQLARQFSSVTSRPLMVHIGSAPPAIEEILHVLESGDIITHFLHGKQNNLLDQHNQPLPELQQAIEKGVLLDVGHGSASFSFRTTEVVKKAKIYPFSISTDIYRDNRRNGPVYSLAHVASKFLYLGYTLADVIDAITVQPARAIRKPHLATITIGEPANLTIFSLKKQKTVLTDANGEQRTTNEIIEPKGVVKDGELITC
ncbi:amidohydrolase/deacetylase family metallohydrolase [Gracilibacillus caseinilyticus]|uniref:Amidohydrolase/deacetylase family metallohydrolase n=1 Tax=Gracilibacillus caseinilyticus TaxID=2932256 RepID=A0ABY4ERL8_9BACI|nr:amidohydrolase/deacetylase family metallohydrolase [Gracilibacillus caseinilyticus]UOQ46726.1 amidohydrolase/deacetylase family metallohydrolase [Gracilibacillus caseinilyticus]